MNISLVLMAYNQAAYVAEAVMGALSQEGPPIEIILSDDCSQDDTFRIMQQAVEAYRGPHRVILRRNATNIGLIAHYRTVFELSSGDVVIVAGGDDVSLPDRAVRIREVFDTTDAWLVYSHATCMDLDGNEMPPIYLGAKFHQGADLYTVATASSLYVGATGAYRKDLFRKYGHVGNPRAYEDLVYGFRAALENRIAFIDRPLIRYRVGSGVSTRDRQPDPALKRAANVRRLRTQYAVLSQRRRDALRFGLSRKDPIPTLINRCRVEVLFELYFLGGINGERCFRQMLRHPVLAFQVLRLFLERDRKERAATSARGRAARKRLAR